MTASVLPSQGSISANLIVPVILFIFHSWRFIILIFKCDFNPIRIYSSCLRELHAPNKADPLPTAFGISQNHQDLHWKTPGVHELFMNYSIKMYRSQQHIWKHRYKICTCCKSKYLNRPQLKFHLCRIYHYWHFQTKTELEQNSPVVMYNEHRFEICGRAQSQQRTTKDKYSRNIHFRTIFINALTSALPNCRDTE